MRGMRLDGRIAVVTGGAGAIGAAVCADLAALGAAVIVADLDEAAAADVAAPLQARAVRVDVGDPASIEEVCAAVGAADIVVHAAGVSIVEPFVTSDPAHWELMWAVNLRGPMLLTQRLLPGMLDRGWGRLVFVSSDGAKAGSGGEGAYAAT